MSALLTTIHGSTPGSPRLPLTEVPFCVVDVETTGGDPREGGITEIGAVRLTGGRCEDRFATLVNPGVPIPPWITTLTGISDAAVAQAPPLHAVIDEFDRFIADAVVVGHNIRYDLAFLRAGYARCGRAFSTRATLCTLALARRLVRDEVPDCKLATLAHAFRVDHPPAHRALDDALATADLLNILIERAGTWGARTLDELLELPRITAHPQAAKLRLTDSLPHAPGVYLFESRSGAVLYVGKATDLRARVRSYFGGDERRKVGALLRETSSIRHEVCEHPLAAAVREIELIRQHEPRFNSRSKRWSSSAYVTLTDETFPRLGVTRRTPPRGAFHIGPLPSVSAAHRVVEAITSVVPLRRCTRPVRLSESAAGQLTFDGMDHAKTSTPRCLPAQLGLACCPCSGEISARDYARHVARVEQGVRSDPESLLADLRLRMERLARQLRFEEAAEARTQAAEFASALIRQRRLESWREARRVTVERADGAGAELVHGRLACVWDSTGNRRVVATIDDAMTGAIRREELFERLCIVSELERRRSPWRITHVDGTLAVPASPIDGFEPARTHRLLVER